MNETKIVPAYDGPVRPDEPLKDEVAAEEVVGPNPLRFERMSVPHSSVAALAARWKAFQEEVGRLRIAYGFQSVLVSMSSPVVEGAQVVGCEAHSCFGSNVSAWSLAASFAKRMQEEARAAALAASDLQNG